MKRAILTALGIGLMVGSAAALDIAGTRPADATIVHDPLVHVARARETARAEQRDGIERRYIAEREACESLGGYARDKCLVRAHANKGRAMLQAAAPYARY